MVDVWCMVTDDPIGHDLAMVHSHLNERQRRLVAAVQARILGHGGVTRVARASGLSRQTIHRGLRELDAEDLAPERIRKSGGGRKPLRETDPKLLGDLDALVAPVTRGHPASALRWTCKSTRQLATELKKRGHAVSHTTVAQMLKTLGYSLQATAKTIEGKQHPDRDAQFRYINRQVKAFTKADDPVISVDTKKKELIGPYSRKGREYQPKKTPERVNVHDFIDPEQGKAIPYGVYDVAHDEGWVNVGCDHDTAEFAVQSIRRWWKAMGAKAHPEAVALLICADCGGSNGNRTRQWKSELQKLAIELAMPITVCHLPPGTSKWNKIEHRLFSHVSMNWRGRPLVTHEVMVNLIRATSTRSGLRVKARLDKRRYPTKVSISDEQMAAMTHVPHRFHGEWNYTIKP